MSFRRIAVIGLILLVSGCGRSHEDLLREGRELQGEGNLRGAIVLYKNALEQNPGDAEARFLLADCYLAADRFDLSEKEFRKTALQDPSRAEVRLRLAELYIRTRRPDAAIAELNGFRKARGDDPKALDLQGRALLLKKETAGAELAFRRALQIDPGMRSARLHLAEALARGDRDGEARRILNALLVEDPQNIAACRLLAHLETADGKIDAALDWYRKIRKLDPQNGEAAYHMGLLLLEKGDTAGAARVAAELLKANPALPEGLRLRGLVHFVKEEFEQAVADLTKTVEGRNDLTALYFLGLSHLKLGRNEQALNQFQRFLDFRPDAIQPRIMIAAILLRQKRVDDAVSELERVLEADKENAAAHTLLGNAFLSRGDFDRAMTQFDRALAIDPDLPEAHYRKGLFKFSRGDFESGEKDLARAVTVAPDLPDSRLLLALRYLQRGNHGEAVRLLERGLRGESGDALLYNYLALAHFARKDPDKGVQCLLKAKELRPDYLTSYYNLAGHYLQRGEPERALREYRAALARRPGDLKPLLAAAEAAGRVGTEQALDMALSLFRSGGEWGRTDMRLAVVHAGLLERRGRFREALAAYEKIAAGSGPHPGTLFAMGALHDRLGEREKALGYYRRILEKEPDFTPALNNLACLYAERPADRPEALELARRAYRLEPENPWILDTLGYILLRTGRGDEAEPILKKAAARLPGSPTVLYHLALAYRDRERGTEAADILRRALALGSFPEAEEARTLLAGLSGTGKGKKP